MQLNDGGRRLRLPQMQYVDIALAADDGTALLEEVAKHADDELVGGAVLALVEEEVERACKRP